MPCFEQMTQGQTKEEMFIFIGIVFFSLMFRITSQRLGDLVVNTLVKNDSNG